MLEVVGSWWRLTFDLGLFWYFSNSGYTFWMAWPSNFIFSLEIHLENIAFKVIATMSRSRERKSGSMQLKNYWYNCWGLIGICVMITLEVIWSFWHFDLDLWPWDIFIFFWIQALSFEFLKLAASVWRYVFIIYLGYLQVSLNCCDGLHIYVIMIYKYSSS